MHLFVLYLHPLVCRLEQACGNDLLVAYADDISVIVTSSEQIEAMNELFVRFELVAGAKLNVRKTVAIDVGYYEENQIKGYSHCFRSGTGPGPGRGCSACRPGSFEIDCMRSYERIHTDAPCPDRGSVELPSCCRSAREKLSLPTILCVGRRVHGRHSGGCVYVVVTYFARSELRYEKKRKTFFHIHTSTFLSQSAAQARFKHGAV